MWEISWLLEIERKESIGKKTEYDKCLVFKALANRFWHREIVHGSTKLFIEDPL